MALTTTLAVLLLVCQLPLANVSLASAFSLDSATALPEAEDPEFEFADPPAPDLYFEARLQPRQSRRIGIASHPILTAGEVPLWFTDIRAPPAVS